MAWEIARLTPGGPAAKLSQTIIHYLAVGEASRILPALRSIHARKSQGPWDPVAMGILRLRYSQLMRELAASVDSGPHVRLGVDRLTRRLSRGPLKDIQAEMDRILGQQPDSAMLLVALERVRALIARQHDEQAADNGKETTRKRKRATPKGRRKAAAAESRHPAK
jgi:hypothetical protein